MSMCGLQMEETGRSRKTLILWHPFDENSDLYLVTQTCLKWQLPAFFFLLLLFYSRRSGGSRKKNKGWIHLLLSFCNTSQTATYSLSSKMIVICDKWEGQHQQWSYYLLFLQTNFTSVSCACVLLKSDMVWTTGAH